MSPSLITRSPDLQQLVDEEYDIEVTLGGHLLLKGVPYVTHRKNKEKGVLVSELEIEMGPEGVEVTKKPDQHVVKFIGEEPCDQCGVALPSLIDDGASKDLESWLTINYMISRLPQDGQGYRDFYHKMTTYFRYLSRFTEIIES